MTQKKTTSGKPPGKKRSGVQIGDDAEKYRFLIEATNTGFVILDDRGRVLDANPEYVRMTGRGSLGEIRGKRVTEWTAPYDLERNAAEVAKCLQTGSVRDLVVDYVSPAGTATPIEINATVFAGPPARIYSLCRDIADRRLAEQALWNSEKRYRALFESLDAAVLLMRGPVCVDCNPATLTLFGLSSKDEIVGKTPLNFAPPRQPDGRDSAEFVRWNIEQALATGLHIFEWQAFRKNGSPVLMEVRFTPYRIGDEQYFQCIAIDITERRKAEQAVAERSAMLQQIMDTASVAIFLVDKTGRITHANRRMAEMFGRSHDELVGREYVDLVHPSEQETGRKRMLALLASEIPSADLERRYRRSDGTEFWGHLTGRRFHDHRGSEIGLIGVIADITERKRAEDLLRENEERYHDLFENAIDAICITDKDQNYLDVNRRAVELFGYSREELLTMNVRDMLPPEQVARSEREFAKLAEAGSYEKFAAQVRRKDGTSIDIEVSSSAIIDRGRFTGSRDIIRDITERKLFETRLRESEEMLKQSQRVARIGHYALDIPSGTWTSSETLDEIFGIGEGYERTVEGWLQIVHPGDRDAMAAYFRDEVLGQRKPFERDYRIMRIADGEERWVTGRGTIEADAGGRLVRMFGTIQDITERKRSEERLRESEGRFRALFENVNVVALVIDPSNGRILDANEAAAAYYGWSRERLRTMEIWDINMLPRDEILRRMDLVKNKKAATFLLPHRLANGSVRDVEAFSGPIPFEGRTVLYSVIHDVTERRQAEEKLQQSERMLQTIIDAEPECVKLLDENACLIMMNRAGLEMLQVDSLEKVKGQCVCPMITSAYRPAFLDLTKRVFRGETGTLVFEMVGVRGRHLWMETHAAPLRNEKDEIVAALGVTRDITERRKAEEDLRQSEQRFRDLAESLPLTVFEMDLQGRFTYVNPAALETFGYAQEEVDAGLTMQQVIVPRDRERAVATMSLRLAGDQSGYIEYEALRRDGTTFPITVASSPILRDDRPVGLRGIVTDLSERKLLEEERLRAQKLESIGTLAGGIAHDFNNLLQGVFGYISMAKLTLDDRAKSLAMLEQAERALHRTVGLTSQLLTFSKGGKPVKRPLSLRPVIENAVSFALSGSRARYELVIADDLRPIEADEGQLGQVLQNIVLNADQAMPLGGTITVAAGNSAVRPDFVEISIRDSGAGIPAEYLAKIFDPYFTTKEKGSGLGLATAYSIVKNHGGEIAVASEQGAGSTFTVLLPATEAAPEDARRTPAPARGRAGRILVMDDEAVVRKVSRELIAALGHDVVTVERGEDALEAYRDATTAGRPFDLVILDLTVRGGMGGAETMRQLLALDPSVKAIVSSGYSDESIAANFRQHGFQAFLQKPYGINELQRTLIALLT